MSAAGVNNQLLTAFMLYTRHVVFTASHAAPSGQNKSMNAALNNVSGNIVMCIISILYTVRVIAVNVVIDYIMYN